MSDVDNNIEKFNGFIRHWGEGYKHAVFAYLALKMDEEPSALISGAVTLSPLLDPAKLTLFTHETDSIIAGIGYWEIENGQPECLSQIHDGLFVLPDGTTFHFAGQNGNEPWSQFDSGNSILKSNQPRSATLRVVGFDLENLLQRGGGLDEIDCELRSAARPFDGLDDLCDVLGVAKIQLSPKAALLISATNLLVVDRSQSQIINRTAKIRCLMSPALDRGAVRIGMMPWDRNVLGRISVSGSEINWTAENGVATGEIEIDAGDSPAVLVLLSHSNTLFDRWWIFDPEKHINALYAVHNNIDIELKELRRFLSGQSKNPAGDFENGIAILLGLFRFSVLHYGLTPTLRESPDLVAFTETNQLFVIECTTAVPNENNKISKLIVRADRVRTSLRASGNSHIDVLPVIVTTVGKATVLSEIADGARRGVLVVTKEDIDNLLDRIRLPPVASALFAEAKAQLSLAADTG